MPIPARILRAAAQDISRPDTGASATRDHILNVAQHLMATYGSEEITFANLAIALCMGTTTLRRQFADIHALLGEVLRRHVRGISAALGKVPAGTTDQRKALRAAYYNFAHAPFGGLTAAHHLFQRDRHLLPPDERETIDIIHANMGRTLAGGLGAEALMMLDSPFMELARIETLLATPTDEVKHAATKPEPAPPMVQQIVPPGRPVPRPADPDAPGAWIFHAGIPGLPPTPANFVVPEGTPEKPDPSPGLRPALTANCLALAAPPAKNRAARRLERALLANARTMAKFAASQAPPKTPPPKPP